jgi:hypothetical protein
MDLTNQDISIRGILVPAAWDQNGNVTRVGLMTEDEEEYLLDEGGNSVGLFSLVRRQVQVRGRARQEGGRKIIVVETCAQIR